MGTITITAAGFGGGPNGNRVGTLSDTDYARLIAWARARTKPNGADVRTDAQVLSDFVGAEWQAWKDAIAVFERPVPTPPTPIGIS
jgi:hypothetical protein